MTRFRVILLLISLFLITYLDRVCISVAGPRMQADLGIGPVGWGWITGIFTVAYGLFEIPTGVLGDRRGPRRVLTRIVLWWSLFTVLTGTVSGFLPLLLTRFLFGVGEAGAFPNASIVIDRWFSAARRATLCGVMLTSSQLGGALAPLLVVPLQQHYGWRMSFYAFGALGVAWALVWYLSFRDSPPERGTASTEGLRPAAEHSFPWRVAFTTPSTLALLVTAFCYVYSYNFFQTWFHTFLVKGRGVSESGLTLSSLTFVVAAGANLFGGAVSDLAVKRFGTRLGRRIVGVSSLTVAGISVLLTMSIADPTASLIFLTIAYAGITFQQSGVFGVCLDVGGGRAGAAVGMMNTAAQVGGFVGSIAFGYIVSTFGSYNAPFLPMAALLFIGAASWFKIDASLVLKPGPGTVPPAIARPSESR